MSAQPWKVVKEASEGNRDNWTLHLVDGKGELGGWLVEMQTCLASDDEEREFDAATMRLIEAAPAMLQALRELCDLTPQSPSYDWHIAMSMGAAAIKQAGEQP